ncbi:hypothetical protein, partial [Halopenitus salinus]
AGGGAPKGNTNAEIHGGFSDWRKAYERFDGETKAYVEHLRECMRETAKEHAPDVPEDRRERLIKENATLSVLWHRAAGDAFGTPENPVDGARGIVIEEEREHNGETYTVYKENPAWRAERAISRRERSIGRELRLYPAFQDGTDQ